MNNNTYIGQTGESGDTGSGFDWGTTLNTFLATAGAYFTNRAAGKQPTTTGGGGTTIIQQGGGMSSTTKALLIGGGILAAGLLVYAITKKK
jgi:hypothetical protein